MLKNKVESKLGKYIDRLFKVFQMNELRILPGNIAFFFVLALIPMITVILSIFSGYVDSLVEIIREMFPGDASAVILNVISNNEGTGITFSIVTLFVASNGTYAIVNAANTLYKIRNRDFIRDRIKAVILLLLILILLAFLIIVPMFGGVILSWFKNFYFYPNMLFIYNLLKWPITIFLIYSLLKVIYTISPSKFIRSKSTTMGAVLTTTIWTIATAVFGFYLQNFANYTEVYGNLANIIILMMWLYIISYVFVLGMAVNSIEYENSQR